MQVAIDQSGRMVLPKAIRDDLGLRPGDRLDAEEQGDAIVLRPVRETGEVHRKGGVLVVTSSAAGSLDDAVDGHRRQRMRHVAGAGWRE